MYGQQMRLQMAIISAVLLVGTSSCAGGASDSSELKALKQERDDLAAQVKELQSKLDELLGETPDTVEPSTPTSTEETTTTAASSGKPAAPDASESVRAFGDISVLSLPAGDPGVVAVVAATAALDRSGSLPVIVRNNTTKTIGAIEVTGIARDATGNLAGSGSSQGFKPALVKPGEIAFGYVFFGDVVGQGLTFDLTASGEEPGSFFSSVPVQITELTVSAEQIIGIVTNGTAEQVSGPISIDGVCFSPAGDLLGTVSGYSELGDLAPGGVDSFSISLYGQFCTVGLLAASGYSM